MSPPNNHLPSNSRSRPKDALVPFPPRQERAPSDPEKRNENKTGCQKLFYLSQKIPGQKSTMTTGGAETGVWVGARQ